MSETGLALLSAVLTALAIMVFVVWFSGRPVGSARIADPDKAQAIESLATIFETTAERAERYLESGGGNWRETYTAILFDDEREKGFRLWLNRGGRRAGDYVAFPLTGTDELAEKWASLLTKPPPKRTYYG